MDTRPYCDHSSFKGPCSKQKHEAIAKLNPHMEGYDAEKNCVNPLLAFAVQYANFIDNIRFTADGFACRCCREIICSIF